MTRLSHCAAVISAAIIYHNKLTQGEVLRTHQRQRKQECTLQNFGKLYLNTGNIRKTGLSLIKASADPMNDVLISHSHTDYTEYRLNITVATELAYFYI